MTRVRQFAKCRLILAVLAVVGLMQVAGYGQTTRPRRIAGFGSSVAFGIGDEFGKEGYTGLLRAMLAPKGWEVLNQSRSGDTTKLLATRWTPEGTPDPRTRYLLPVNPSYVIIGLSLANEGIFEARTKEEKDAVFQQYADGIRGLIAKARQQNIVAIVALCYPRLVYTPIEYEYTRRINILQNSWDVPTVNFLGALDDGNGRWARGFMFNDKHPNASGHQELALTFVPTLFEALEKGKAAPSKPAVARGFARISAASAPLTFTPESTMHPFAVSMTVRTQGSGTLAAISGSLLAAKMEQKRSDAGRVPVEFEEAVLSVDRPFTSTIGVENGKWAYMSADGTRVTSSAAADEQWHQIVLSHYTARGETLFFVDGKLTGTVGERLEPNRFVIGGPGSAKGTAAPKEADYKDLFLFRSALNPDEVAILNQGKMLQSSLEIYAPLVDTQFRPGSMVENRAQSMKGLEIGSGRIVHVDDNVRQTR
jgi:lysophospholipase L1-like esterase